MHICFNKIDIGSYKIEDEAHCTENRNIFHTESHKIPLYIKKNSKAIPVITDVKLLAFCQKVLKIISF